MATRRNAGFTVGSLLGLPLGSVRAPSYSPAPVEAEEAVQEQAAVEGPGWSVAAGEVRQGRHPAWRSDGIEALDYNNPFGQVMERVWFDGKIIFAVDLGRVDVDPMLVKVAQEYQIVYAVQLDESGKSIAEAELVPGQFNIYDTVPEMDRYSPIWQFNYVLVPRDYVANTLRSEGDCLASGYQILRSQDFEN